MKILGIDYGTKKIGVALSDESTSFAFPYSIIETRKTSSAEERSGKTLGVKEVSKIKKICENHNVSKIILGRSLDFKGRPNPVQTNIENFKLALEKETGLLVEYQDETLTTSEAKRSPDKINPRKGAPKIKPKDVDASAAALILQSYLDKQ